MPVVAAAPVATRAPMAMPPHMAPVTVGGVTMDPALLHMSIPDDEPMLDDVEVTKEEASALESELGHLHGTVVVEPGTSTGVASAHHGTAVAPAVAVPRSTASGPSHPAAAPPGASSGGDAVAFKNCETIG